MIKELEWRPGAGGGGVRGARRSPRCPGSSTPPLPGKGCEVSIPRPWRPGASRGRPGRRWPLGAPGWGGSVLLTPSPVVERTRRRNLPAPRGWGACASARGASAPRPEAARAQLGPAALWAKLRSQPRAAPDPTLLIITNVPFAERDFIFAENSSEILISSHSTGPNR